MTGNANRKANKKAEVGPGYVAVAGCHTRTWEAWQGVSNGCINNAGSDGKQAEHA